MRGIRAKAAPLAAALIAASAAGCGVGAAATTPRIGGGPTGKPITIGISLPLTGQFSADGVASERGYELWKTDVNSRDGLLGHPVKLVISNDKSDPNITVKDYRTLITQDHVDLILAPFSSLLTAAAIPVAQKYHYAFAAGSAGAPLVYSLKSSYFFSTNVPVKIQMEPFAHWVESLTGSARPTTAAYPMVSDPFADPPVQTTQGELQKAGIRTVYSHAPYNKTTPAALKADADAVVKSGAQMVVLGSVDVPTVSAFIHEFIAKNYNPKILIASAGPDQGQAFIGSVGVGNAIGIMVPNGWYGDYPNPLSHVMVQEYIARYGGNASGINADVAEAYSAGEVLQAGVEGSGGFSNPAIASYLHAHTVQTDLGPVRFKSDGENEDALTSALIFQWQAGEHFVQVLPTDQPGTKKIITTKPGWTG